MSVAIVFGGVAPGPQIRQLSQGVDVLVTASSMEPACKIDDKSETLRTYPRQARQAINVTGHPAIAVPTGYSSDGMPLAMQIIGRPFDEVMVYRFAQAFEQATEWHTRRAPVAVAA